MTYVIRPEYRAAFKGCRRAWDFSSPARRNYEPAGGARAADIGRGLRDALAVYYFPGMWKWDRDVVRPLVVEGFTRSLIDQGDDGQEQLQQGTQLLERYFAWAPAADDFVPIRVETDFSVRIPDPARHDRDLSTTRGEPIQYEGRIDMLVVDSRDTYWIVEHRMAPGGWANLHDLMLDERGASYCWAWELFYLGMEVSGVIYNELCTGDWDAESVVRRTKVRRSRTELRRLREQMANEALDMVDPATRIYPNPSPSNCGACGYRSPCVAVSRGAAAEEALAHHRRRTPEEVEEGRLGGVTWSMGRGAAPPRFGRSGNR